MKFIAAFATLLMTTQSFAGVAFTKVGNAKTNAEAEKLCADQGLKLLEPEAYMLILIEDQESQKVFLEVEADASGSKGYVAWLKGAEKLGTDVLSAMIDGRGTTLEVFSLSEMTNAASSAANSAETPENIKASALKVLEQVKDGVPVVCVK